MEKAELLMEKVTLTDTDIVKNPNRHCAFCLVTIGSGSEKVNLCGGCRKRAYCSKECQVADWSLKKNGQGHKNWCQLPCGEEDLDWEVAPVPGKGLGLIAKRLIPAKFRIIVDGLRSTEYPAVSDLVPVNGTTDEKLYLNGLGCGSIHSEINALCLRIARANHRCDSNAGHYYDATFKVKILFAEKDIQKGEEICITYQPFNDISNSQTADASRSVLASKWGILCPEDCFCRDKGIEKLVRKSKNLDSEIFRMASSGNTVAALKGVKELMDNHDVIHSSLINKHRTLYDGFQIAIMKKNTCKQAEDFIRQAYDIKSVLTSPRSDEALEMGKFVKDMKLHRNYLILD